MANHHSLATGRGKECFTEALEAFLIRPRLRVSLYAVLPVQQKVYEATFMHERHQLRAFGGDGSLRP